MYKEILVVVCLAAFVVVQAYPAAEDIESLQPSDEVEIEADPNSVADDDLEGSESRYGRRYYGGGWGRGYGGGWGGGGYYRGYGYYGGGGGWGRGYGHRRHHWG